MEINQAAQTFLLFFFIFALSLVGLGFHLKFKKNSPKISLANAVETSILVVGIFTLLVFGGSYYFVLSDANPSTQPLKDALSITASFFGGLATLTAAYIASRLFNDWKEQKKYEVPYSLTLDALTTYIKSKDTYFKYLVQYAINHKHEVISYATADNLFNEALLKIRLLDAACNALGIEGFNVEIDYVIRNYTSIQYPIENEEELKKLDYEKLKLIHKQMFKNDDQLRKKMIEKFGLE